jgi:SAM-dependent methyltransferase
MSLLSFIKQFGARQAVTKAQSAIALRLLPRAALQRVMVDPAALQRLKTVDTSTMPPDYKAYVEEQINRSMKRSAYVNPLRALIGTRDRLIRQVAEVSRAWKVTPSSVLSIGCRDERELDTLAALLRSRDVTGVDLFSASPRIRTADMHALPFDAETFDVSFAIHCMEHSYDARKSLAEMVRVTKRGGLLGIEVPIGFEVTPFDRNDFIGVVELAALFPERAVSVLWAELENRDASGKPPTLRMILRKTL